MQIEQKKKAVLSFFQKCSDNCTIKCWKYYRNQADGSIDVEKRFDVESGFAPSECELFNQLKNYYNLIKNDLDESSSQKIIDIMNNLTPCYKKGDKMLKIAKLKKLTFSDDDTCVIQEGAEIDFEKGIVYVLNFWDEKSIDNGIVMETSEEAFEQNPQWQGKVKLIGLNWDLTTEFMIQEIKSNKWKQFQHYQTVSLDEPNEMLFQELRRGQGSQFLMLINKWGRVVVISSYSKGDLEEKINGLLADDVEPEQEIAIDPHSVNSLTEAEYKEVKKNMKKFSIKISETGYNGDVGLQFQKVNYLKPNGTKIFNYCSPLRLSYNINVKNRPQINAFLENEWKELTEHMKEITDEKIQDPEGSYQKFLEAFSSVGADIYQEHVYYTDINLDEAKSSFQVVKAQDQWLYAKNLDFHKFNKACGILKEQADKDHCDFGDYTGQIKNNQLSFCKGYQYVPLTGYFSWKDEQYTDIEHVPGQVLVIQYWNCGGMPENIKSLVELAEKNQERWGKSVRLIVFWLSGKSEENMELIQQYTKYVDFYSLQAWDQIAQDYMGLDTERDIYYIVVDKFGIIRIAKELSLDFDVIDDLFLEQNSQQIQDEGDFTEEAAQNLINFTQQAEIHQKLLQINKPKFLDFRMHLQWHKIEDKTKFKKPTLNVTCRDFQLQEINWILENLFQIISEDKWKINKQFQKTMDVEYPGSVCAVCQKDILQQPQQYYSPFKKEHVCVECAEFDDQTKKGAERFKYLDTLIFINGPLTDLSVLTNIDADKIGNNLQLQEGEEPNQNHQMYCDGCGIEQGARYIAANAKVGEPQSFVDYCQACFIVLKDKKSEKAQEIIKKNEGYGMSEDNLLIRILFNHGYKNF